MKKNILTLTLLFISMKSLAIYQGLEVKDKEYNYNQKIRVGNDKQKGSPCSAVIISRFTLMTAAHCLDNLILSKDMFLYIQRKKMQIEYVWIPLEYFDNIKFYFQAKEYEHKKRYHRLLAKYDIGIITLKRSLPKRFNHAKLNFEEQFSGSEVSVFGLGHTKYNKREDEFYGTPKYPMRRDHKLIKLENDTFLVTGINNDDFITTPGDSGGGLFLKGTHELIGITRGSSFTNYTSGSIFTPLYLLRSFILRYIKE